MKIDPRDIPDGLDMAIGIIIALGVFVVSLLMIYGLIYWLLSLSI